MSRKDTSIETESSLMVAWAGEGEAGWRVTANGPGVPFWGGEIILKLDCGESCTSLWIH